MSKIRFAAVLIVLMTLVVSAKNHFTKDDPLIAQYKICRDGAADKDEVLSACNEMLTQSWLPEVTRSALLRRRAANYRQRGEFDLAISDANEAILLTPKDAYAFRSRSEIHLDLDDLEHAELDYEKAVSLAPKKERLVEWWIKRMSQIHQPERALAGCERLRSIDRGDEPALVCGFGPLLRLERYDEAVALLKEATSTGGEEARQLYFGLGRLYLHLDYSKQETVGAFEAWQATGEERRLQLLFLAATYLKFGDEIKGKGYIEEVATEMSRRMGGGEGSLKSKLGSALGEIVFQTAGKRYFAGLAYSIIREYDRAKQEFDRFVLEGGPNAKALLVRVMVEGDFVPSAEMANVDQRIFSRGLERYMVHNGRHFTLDALSSTE